MPSEAVCANFGNRDLDQILLWLGMEQALVNGPSCKDCLVPWLVLNLGRFRLPKSRGFADRPGFESLLLTLLPSGSLFLHL